MYSEFRFRALTSEDWKGSIAGYLSYDIYLSLEGKDTEKPHTLAFPDSGIPECSWYRIVLDADIPEESSITVSFTTSETPEVKNSSDHEKPVSFVFTKAKDVFIQVPSGRHVQLQINLHREREDVESPVLRQVKIFHDIPSYTSKPLDSGVSGCLWHRIVLDADIPENSTITVSYITSETEDFENPSDYEKPAPIVFTKAKDALINAQPGRYIQLEIDFHRGGKEAPVLREVKIYYERLSYLRYLPAVYQENSESKEFLERFLSIFESSLYDSEETISNIPIFFDPMAAPEDFYRWLADWLSLDLYDLLEEDKKREFILRAVEFYKKKGTVSGLEDLVTFLTGKKCCIKEYKNNVFRSWGMEHHEEYELEDDKANSLECEAKLDQNKVDKIECTKFYRRISRTVDTDPLKADLLANRGKYCDEMHYTIDTSDDGTYSPYVIGIFIFLQQNDGFTINEKEYARQLHKIIDSFLPVFVRAKVHIVVMPYIEQYDTNRIIEKYNDSVHVYLDEELTPSFGHYKDETNWIWIYSFDDEYKEKKITNNVRYRTVHSGIGHESKL